MAHTCYRCGGAGVRVNITPDKKNPGHLKMERVICECVKRGK